MRCDILIPVGPGHENICQEAAGSVNIAAQYHKGPFDEIGIQFGDDLEGKRGRSKTRNDLIAKSKADWLFFLDADDLMHPAAFRNLPAMLAFAKTVPAAIWGLIVEYRDGCLMERYQIPEIESYHDLIQFDPTQTIQMGHFVQRDIATLNPFDTEMDTGEDWDYYLRVWKSHNCIKINKPLMINRRGQHSTGPRSATGRDWNVAVGKIIAGARG